MFYFEAQSLKSKCCELSTLLPVTEFAKSKLYAEESKAERTIGFIS